MALGTHDDVPVHRDRPPRHPGTILRRHFMEPRGVTVTALAAACGVSRKHLSRVLNGHTRLEPGLAAALARAFGTTAAFWINLQANLDAWHAGRAVPADTPPLFPAHDDA